MKIAISPVRVLVVALLLWLPTWVSAQTTINVATDAQLRAALNPTTGAQNGDTIRFTANITLTGDLPTVQNSVTINGNNNTLSGNNQFRGLFVGAFSGSTQVPVSVTVQDLAIADARAQGGAGEGRGGGGAGLGGALFVANQATLTVSNVTLTGNSVVGGAGEGTSGSVGGGGGMGGNGGSTVGGGGGLGVGSTGGAGGFPSPRGLDGIATGGSAGGTGGTGGGGGTVGGANGGGGGGAVSGGGGGSGAGGGVGGANGVNGPGTGNGGAGGFGGGGGAGNGATGGAGGFGGGGGNSSIGGAGGFGGGGGGGGGVFGSNAGGTGGFGGGNGSVGNSGVGGGGGGAGLGGAVFVQQGGTLNVAGAFNVGGGAVTAGAGGGTGTPGSAFGSGIFLQGNGTVNFAPGAGVTQTISNVIADQTGSGGTGVNAGSWTLAKSGPGMLTLSGANSYSGGTAINGGTLNVSADNNLGSVNGGISFGGGTLHLGAAFALAGTRALTVNAGGGTIDTNNFNTTISQAISGIGGLTKSGFGTLTLSAVNSYSGGTTVTDGTLRMGVANAISNTPLTVNGGTFDMNNFNLTVSSLAGAGGSVSLGSATLTVDQTGDTTFAGELMGAGALVKRGAGTLALGGANSYTGATTIAAGTLKMGHAQALGATSLLTIDAPGTLDLNGFSIGFGRVEGTGRVALGGGTFSLGLGDASATFEGQVVGTGTFAKTGTGTLTLTGANTHTGTTRVDAGTLLAGAVNTLSAGSRLTVASGATVDLAGFSQTIGSLDGYGAVDLGSATLTTGGDGGSTTFGGAIFGTGSVVKTGNGTWTLTGANGYTGATIINAGTLRLGTAGAIGRSSGVIVQRAGTLDLNSFNHSFGSLGGDGSVTLGGATLTLGLGDASSTLAATVSGSGSLVKTGRGVLNVTGANTYTGGTTVEAGALIGNTGSLPGAIRNNATVAFDQTGDGIYAGVISGSGALIKQGGGGLTLTGANSYSGGTLVSGGTLTGTTRTLQGPILVDAGLRIDQAFNGTFGGVIGGAGTVTKTGAGTLTLTGAHPFNGVTTVAGGTLALDGTLAGTIAVQPGATLSGQGGIGGSVTVGTGAVVSTPAAELTPAVAAPIARPVWATAAADVQASVATLGQLTVVGDLVVGQGGTLQTTVTNTGDSTLLAIGGAARIGGATIDLTTLGSAHPRVMQSTVMAAAGGIQGEPIVRMNTPALEGWLTSDGKTLFVTVLNTTAPLAAAATSANGAAVGAAVDRARAAATGDLRSVTRELAALDDSGLGVALDQVSGEIHGTALQLTALDAEAAADLVRGEVAGRRVHGSAGVVESGRANATNGSGSAAWGAGRRWWGRFLGQRVTLDAAGGARDARGHLGGFALGVDGARGAWLFGGGGGYSLGELTLSGGDEADTTAPRAFGYAGYGRGRWTMQVGSSVSRPSYQTGRAMAFTARLDPRFGTRALFGGVDRQAEADVHGLDTGVWLDAQAAFTRGAWLLQPGLGVRTARYGRSSWTEAGAGALSLEAPDQAVTSTQADATLRLARAEGRFRPYGSATYRRELGAGLTTTTLRLSSDSASRFDVHGLPLAEDRIIGTIGLTAGPGFSFGYRIDSGGGQVRHAVDFGVRFE